MVMFWLEFGLTIKHRLEKRTQTNYLLRVLLVGRIASMLANRYGKGLFYKVRARMDRIDYFRSKLTQNCGEVSSW